MSAAAATAKPQTIAILGAGQVGGALAKRWASLGHRVILGSRTPSDPRFKALLAETGAREVVDNKTAAEAADIAVLTTPFRGVRDMAAAIAPHAGRILTDVTNAVNIVQGNYYVPGDMTRSGGEMLQEWLPEARVVKAFNAMSVEAMRAPTPLPVSVPIAGADAEAKAQVAALAAEMGLKPIDVGGLYFAHNLEDMARLRMTFHAHNHPMGFDYYLQQRPDLE